MLKRTPTICTVTHRERKLIGDTFTKFSASSPLDGLLGTPAAAEVGFARICEEAARVAREKPDSNSNWYENHLRNGSNLQALHTGRHDDAGALRIRSSGPSPRPRFP